MSPELLIKDVFNGALFETSQGSILIARQRLPYPDGFSADAIDYTNLVAFELDQNGNVPRQIEEIHISSSNGARRPPNWEDPRILQQQPNHAVLGLTAADCSNGIVEVHPALLRICQQDGQVLVEDGPWVLRGLVGKNTTPIADDGNAIRFLYRDEADPHSLFLQRLILGPELTYQLEAEKRIGFRTRPWWIEHKVGTVAAPFKLRDGTLFHIIHGQTVVGGRHEYRLGGLITSSDYTPLKISQNPYFEREDLPAALDYHPQKKVIYSCGFTVQDEMVTLLVNAGDRDTYRIITPLDKLLGIGWISLR